MIGEGKGTSSNIRVRYCIVSACVCVRARESLGMCVLQNLQCCKGRGGREGGREVVVN